MVFEPTKKFQSLFPRVRYPIVQAPMAGTATPELAAAVSNFGGVGSLGIGSGTVPQARELIEQTQALTDKPFNINVFCHEPATRDGDVEKEWLRYLTPLFDEFEANPPAHIQEIYKSFIVDDESLEMLLEKRPSIVSFHFGLPKSHQLVALRDAGITTLATATNVADAKAVEAAGIDGIVAQGIEAGGHRGRFSLDGVDEELPTAILVRTLVKHTDLPIIAAGGIMDGQGIKAMLDLGAVAAQLGTAFILCPESAANNGYRDALSSQCASSTRLTPILSGRPARGIVNRLVEFGEAPGSPAAPDYPVTYDATKHLIAAAKEEGGSEIGAYWAGQGAPLAREMSASSLMTTLVEELNAT